jgi:hypothetical protein
MKLFVADIDQAIMIGEDSDPTPTGYTDKRLELRFTKPD